MFRNQVNFPCCSNLLHYFKLEYSCYYYWCFRLYWNHQIDHCLVRMNCYFPLMKLLIASPSLIMIAINFLHQMKVQDSVNHSNFTIKATIAITKSLVDLYLISYYYPRNFQIHQDFLMSKYCFGQNLHPSYYYFG